MPVQAKGQVRPEKSAYHSIALLTESFEKNISLLLPRACSTLDKIMDRCALTIYPYSLGKPQLRQRSQRISPAYLRNDTQLEHSDRW